jgi:xylulokinase
MGYIMTFDVGTTSVKTCLFTEDIKLIAFSSEEYELLTPKKDVVELDPEIYWNTLKKGIREVLDTSGINTEEILVMTLTTQGETLIPVGKDGAPLYNALVWLDARAVEESAIITGLIASDTFYRHTGLPEAGPACPVCKVLWFKRNQPELFEKIFKFLLLEDYLLFKLTGKFISEQSLMSSSGYFDINSGILWQELLDSLDINCELFPEVLPCGEIIGNISKNAALELGLSTLTIVSTGAMDQISSAIGAGNIYPGIVTETTGTAMVIGATTIEANYSNISKVIIYKHYNKNFLLLPYCPTAGIVLKWFKDEFCGSEMNECKANGKSIYQMLDELASVVKPGANGLIFLPHLAGALSPEVNPYAKGVFFGISLETKKAHFVRAILESIGYMLKENIEMLESLGIEVKEIYSLGGGSDSKLWNSIKADITGKHILVLEQQESTSFGAAILGAVSIGLYNSVEEACKLQARSKNVYIPDQTNIGIYNKTYTTYIEVYNNLKELFKA